MLRKKVNDSFTEASHLLKSDKNLLFEDLKKICQTIDGNQSKKNATLNELSKVLGIK